MSYHRADIFQDKIKDEALEVKRWILNEHRHEAQSSGFMRYQHYADNTYEKTALTLLQQRVKRACIEIQRLTSGREKEDLMERHIPLIHGVGVEKGPVWKHLGVVIPGTAPFSPTEYVIILPNQYAKVTYVFTLENARDVSSVAGPIAVWNDSTRVGYLWNVTWEFSKVNSNHLTVTVKNSRRSGNRHEDKLSLTARNLIGPSRLVVNFKESVDDPD